MGWKMQAWVSGGEAVIVVRSGVDCAQFWGCRIPLADVLEASAYKGNERTDTDGELKVLYALPLGETRDVVVGLPPSVDPAPVAEMIFEKSEGTVSFEEEGQAAS